MGIWVCDNLNLVFIMKLVGVYPFFFKKKDALLNY
jgi:hypothetical protein